MIEPKYKLTEDTINVNGRTLHRIESLKDFGDVKKGIKGGYVENESNLSQNGDCWVSDDAKVYGDAKVYDNAKISRIDDYLVFKNWWSSGRYFTWTKSNNMWKVGCFYGTGKELIEKAYGDSEVSGREYERVVKYVESIIGK